MNNKSVPLPALAAVLFVALFLAGCGGGGGGSSADSPVSPGNTSSPATS